MHNFLFALILIICGAGAFAQRAVLTVGRTALPWQVQDSNGNQWMVYQQGILRQQGEMPLFGQAAMLTINGAGVPANTNQASIDSKTGELVLEGSNIRSGIAVTRRVQVNKQDCYVRYIDVFRNTTGKEQAVSVQYMSHFNYQPTSVQFVEDPRSRDRMVGAAVTLDIGRSVYEVFAGKGAKVAPQLISTPNSNQVQASLQLTIPANKEVALVHVYGIANGPESVAQTILSIKESRLLSDVPIELRKTIINAPAVATIGDREILRGELLDVVELRNGDQLRGTLKEATYKLQAFYGEMELPADRVVSMINIGQFRPRQLFITADGEVIGGALGRESIGIELSSGQNVQVPLVQISRIGYRRRSGEPEEWTFDKPILSLRTGERLFITPPTTPVEVMTRFGPFRLPATAVAAVLFQPEDHDVHEVRLNDGSVFAALVSTEHFDVQLAGTVTQQRVSIPTAMIEQIRLNNSEDVERSSDAPVLELINGDMLVGKISGQHQLDTRFDTITLNGPELRSINRDIQTSPDVQVVLWDQTTIGGQLREALVKYDLAGGISVQVPISLVRSYSNPLPRPSDGMVQRIQTLVSQLSADDWREREQAEAQLIGLGPSVTAVLRDMEGKVPPEAQQRIGSILIQLQAGSDSTSTPNAPMGGRGR